MKNKSICLLLLASLCCLAWACKKSIAPRPVTPPVVGPEKDSVVVDNSLYTVSGSGGLDSGEILLALDAKKNAVLTILDERGSLIREKVSGLKTDNFQKWIINGQTRYSYFQTEGEYTIDGVATEEGYDIVCDSALNEISRITLLPSATVDTNGYDKLDVHEFILLGDDHYIAISNRLETPANIPAALHPAAGAQVIACLIQEVSNGQVIFQWDGTDYPEFYTASVENNDFTDAGQIMDYMHMNSVCIDPNDQNLIVSFRNLNQIVKISRTTGEIIWRLGGTDSDFPLTADQTFLRQHYVRFTDNNQTLIFLDNGLQDVRPYSRIAEFKLDENAKTVNDFHDYHIPDKFIQYAGSVKKMNGSYFIGGGSANYALQVNYSSNEILLRVNQLYPSYRALKY